MYQPQPEVTAFLNEFEGHLAEGTIPMRSFNDAEVHELELDRIFTRAWVFLGHESEIPARGDYVQRRIGRDPFVLVRSEDGEIRVLFDSCRHRGAMVCRAERGNAALFRCPYHGWTYKNTGELAGAPLMKDAYGTSFDKSKMGLHAAPHVDSIHGFIFASLDPGAPSLDEYLGDMKWHLDMVWGQFEDGLEVIGEPQRTVLAANWKAPADNFSGDDYHTVYLHRSTTETGIMENPGGDQALWDGYHVQLGNGHHFIRNMIPPEVPGPRFLGYPEEVQRLVSPTLQGAELYEGLKHTVGFVGTVFPNFGFLCFPFKHDRSGDFVTAMSVRLFEPRAAGEMVAWTWTLCPKGAAEEFRTETYRTTMGTFSAGGTFEQDDSDPWMSITRASGSTYARKLDMQLDYRMGMTGEASSKRVDDYPGPGVAYYSVLEEGGQRGFHRRWLQFMRSTEFPEMMSPEEQNAGAGVAGRNGDG
jgi:phenylpropionate dioxygenase-like ring-hydroxylating dioxygenase large terminal subunit